MLKTSKTDNFFDNASHIDDSAGYLFVLLPALIGGDLISHEPK